jgi:hypothetical protein
MSPRGGFTLFGPSHGSKDANVSLLDMNGVMHGTHRTLMSELWGRNVFLSLLVSAAQSIATSAAAPRMTKAGRSARSRVMVDCVRKVLGS